ncbi:Alpha/beta hydrolase fold-3 [Akanthomyces lecanii RCEF 1005]|uniref:Alpha/beta hydrolase fold-3 n=1 Tax=Akanthomyces lecanii RCEF 1005 TaxID=1081108 RepID=A0A167ZNR3_CORDF|nr:Alpha/beta hydrolase fold-3 [Akanthomyces lecanii RCEF 1005]
MDFAEAIHKYCLRSEDSSYAFPTKLRETPAKHTKCYNGSIHDSESWTEHLLRATLANEQFAANPDSHGHDIYSVAAELYQLIEQVFKTCCILENDHTFADATATYVKGLEWYQNFFRYSKTYTGREPFILFVHTYYHFCILTLLTPYVMDMALVTDGSPPGKICGEAANIILKLMEHRECLAGHTEPRVATHADYLLFDIDYPLAPEGPFPATIHDAEDAVKYLLDSPQEYESTHVSVSGFRLIQI